MWLEFQELCLVVNYLTGVKCQVVFPKDLWLIVIQHSLLDLYAHDAELHCDHLDLSIVETFLQSDLDAVACNWLCSSQLSLNVVKSSSMLIGS